MPSHTHPLAIKTPSDEPYEFLCLNCEGAWRTYDEVIDHYREVHGVQREMAERGGVDFRYTPSTCKDVGCFCGAALGPTKAKFLKKTDAMEYLVNHMVEHHKVSRENVVRDIHTILPDPPIAAARK